MKKIALIIPSLQAGGMERVMSELINEFIKESTIEIHLILFGINREIFYEIPDKVVVHKPSFVFRNKYRLVYTIKTLFFLRNKLRVLNPHSVLSFGERWNNFVLLSSLGLNLSIFVSDRCQPTKSLGKTHNFLRNKLYPEARGIVAQTSYARKIYKEMRLNTNIKVIGNPIRQILKNSEIMNRDNIVLSVGRLIESKHYDDLIKMFVELNMPEWKLIIVGDDALKQQNKKKLKFLIEELKATDKVVLAGKQKDVEVFYLKSKIFAFTSSSEGFPNVIGEAQSSGVPVISFDCVSGPSDMINDGFNGFLVPLFDYDTFKRQLKVLMMSQSLRDEIAHNALKSIKGFSRSHISNKYLEFILA